MKKGLVFAVDGLGKSQTVFVYPIMEGDHWDKRFEEARKNGEKMVARAECFINKGHFHIRVDLPELER